MVARKMVLGGLPLVVVLIRWVPDALFAAKELDAVLLNQLPTAHQLAMGSLFLIDLCLFLGRDVLIVARLVRSVTLPIALATKPVACHAAVLLTVECD